MAIATLGRGYIDETTRATFGRSDAAEKRTSCRT
jgi:hypothetical protein